MKRTQPSLRTALATSAIVAAALVPNVAHADRGGHGIVSGSVSVRIGPAFVHAPLVRHGHRHVRPRVGVHLWAPAVFAPWPIVVPGPYRYGYPWYEPHEVPYAYPFPSTRIERHEYVERAPADEDPGAATAQAPQPGYWYWCTEPRGYYPSVRECPQGWLQVDPQPRQGGSR